MNVTNNSYKIYLVCNLLSILISCVHNYPKLILLLVINTSLKFSTGPCITPRGSSREAGIDDDDEDVDDGDGGDATSIRMSLKGHWFLFLYTVHVAANYFLGLLLIKFLSVITNCFLFLHSFRT